MRIVLLLAAMATWFCSAAQSGAPLTRFNVLHYTYAVHVNDANDSIVVVAVVKARTLAAVTAFDLDLASVNPRTGKGMTVQSVTANFNSGQAITYTHQLDKLSVQMPVEAGRTVDIFIEYRGIPADGLVIGKNKFENRTFFGDNWPNRGHQWLACVDHPADKASFEWQVQAPAYYTVIANGIETGTYPRPGGEKLWIFKEEKPLPVKVAVIGVANMQRQLASGDPCLPVYNYVYPETGEKGLEKLAVAGEIIRFFSSVIGEYPYRKLANVQSTTMFGGMENANAIFYDESAVDGSGSIEALVAHEVAHQWFGNTVTEKTFAHIWLSEGFATFLTHYYLEKKYGVDSLRKRLEDDRAKVRRFLQGNPRPVVDNSTNLMGLLNANSYQKGALFLQALREKAGDEQFWNIVRTFYKRFKYANADTNDFKAVTEELTGKNWDSFFNEWLYSAKLPG